MEPATEDKINRNIERHLETIAEQQKKQTLYLQNISMIQTLLIIVTVLFLLLFALRMAII